MGFAPGPLIRRYGPVRNCFTLHVYIKQESDSCYHKSFIFGFGCTPRALSPHRGEFRCIYMFS